MGKTHVWLGCVSVHVYVSVSFYLRHIKYQHTHSTSNVDHSHETGIFYWSHNIKGLFEG